MDPYQAEAWPSAGAAAALTGLLFVALSLHMEFIVGNQVYRDMARGSLIGVVMALVLSLNVLVRQPVTWLGLEIGFVSLLYLGGVGGQQLWSVARADWQVARSTLVRSLAAYLMALAGLLIGAGLVFRVGPGLYAVALIVVAIMLWNLWNSWVLLVGVADEELAQTSIR